MLQSKMERPQGQKQTSDGRSADDKHQEAGVEKGAVPATQLLKPGDRYDIEQY